MDDFGKEIGQFFFILFQDGRESHQNAEVLLDTQNCLSDLPLLLLHQVTVLFDDRNHAVFSFCCKGCIIGWDGERLDL